MPKGRPTVSGYARLAQADEDDEYIGDSDRDDPSRGYAPLSTPSIASNRKEDPIACRTRIDKHHSPDEEDAETLA